MRTYSESQCSFFTFRFSLFLFLSLWFTLFSICPHPFIFSYERDLIDNKNKYKISKYIWSVIKDTHNFQSTNKFGENLAFSMIKIRLLNGSGSYELESEILKANYVWNKINVNKKTIIHLLINLPYEKYSKFLNKVPINKTQKDEKGKTILDYANKKWLTLLILIIVI